MTWVLAAVVSPVVGLAMAVPAGKVAPRVTARSAPQGPQDESMFDLDAARTGWLDDFQRFAENRPAPTPAPADTPVPDASDRNDAPEKNVVVIAKAVPGFDVPVAGAVPESVAPKDEPKIAPPPVAASALDDAQLTTGSIKPSAPPLLPPVPEPEAFKVHKGDRLGASPRTEPGHAAPDAASVAPHAELGPTKANAALLQTGKSAMLLPVRSDRLKPIVVASEAMKPFDLAPEHPDVLFQGPPMPADPTIDPDAPVLGYAEQMASAEAPFKALFAVSPTAKRSWLGVDTSTAQAKPTKPSKVAKLPHHRSRKRTG